VSYGKQDNIQMAVERILNINYLLLMKQSLNQRLEISENKVTIKELMHFDKNVPHWFCAWFNQQRETDNAFTAPRIRNLFE
jgi:hypothetical protein